MFTLALYVLFVAFGFAVGYLVAGWNYRRVHEDYLKYREYWSDFMEWFNSQFGRA